MNKVSKQSRRYLRKRQVQERYNLRSPKTIDDWVKRGILPPPLRKGRTVLWDEGLLDRHDRRHTREVAA
jgi:predicted DNA-binding transcriptional regulator AlpA